MNITRLTKYHFMLTLISILFISCIEEDICTKRVNIPIWNEKEEIFEDNYQDFPCDYNGIQN